jgi:hypothetical protein
MINENEIIQYIFDNDEYIGISKQETDRIAKENKVTI